MDGANVEIHENVGDENMFLFGLLAHEVEEYELVSMEFGAELLLNVVLAPVMFKFLSLFSAFLIDGTESPR